MATVYAQRSSAVRAAKKACGPEQEWTILQAGEGFTFVLVEVDEELPAPVTIAQKTQVLKETGATEQEHAAHRAEVVRDMTKPWQRAKCIISDCIEGGITTRKELIAHCVAQGIKYNTADGAHFEMCVKGKAK
jgi:hypothetical protein